MQEIQDLANICFAIRKASSKDSAGTNILLDGITSLHEKDNGNSIRLVFDIKSEKPNVLDNIAISLLNRFLPRRISTKLARSEIQADGMGSLGYMLRLAKWLFPMFRFSDTCTAEVEVSDWDRYSIRGAINFSIWKKGRIKLDKDGIDIGCVVLNVHGKKVDVTDLIVERIKKWSKNIVKMKGVDMELLKEFGEYIRIVHSVPEKTCFRGNKILITPYNIMMTTSYQEFSVTALNNCNFLLRKAFISSDQPIKFIIPSTVDLYAPNVAILDTKGPSISFDTEPLPSTNSWVMVTLETNKTKKWFLNDMVFEFIIFSKSDKVTAGMENFMVRARLLFTWSTEPKAGIPKINWVWSTKDRKSYDAGTITDILDVLVRHVNQINEELIDRNILIKEVL